MFVSSHSSEYQEVLTTRVVVSKVDDTWCVIGIRSLAVVQQELLIERCRGEYRLERDMISDRAVHLSLR